MPVLDIEAFPPGKSTLEALQNQVERTDFALMVFSHDDIIHIREEEKRITRDNVIYELGLFTGVLGPERAFILAEDGEKGSLPLRILSDVEGITRIHFGPRPKPETPEAWQALMEKPIQTLRRTIEELGPR